MPTRDEALALLHEHTKTDQLRKHGLAVEAAMRAYARKYGEDEELWGIVGLLHDFDYEAHPEEHPYVGARLLREAGRPELVVEGVNSRSALSQTAPLARLLREQPARAHGGQTDVRDPQSHPHCPNPGNPRFE